MLLQTNGIVHVYAQKIIRHTYFTDVGSTLINEGQNVDGKLKMCEAPYGKCID